MALSSHSIERCLELLGGIVRARPDLTAEFEASTSTFFPAAHPGAARDFRETLLAGRRHLEWFLLEHHSPSLRGSVAEKLSEEFAAAVDSATAQDEDANAARTELAAALDALLRSHTGIFEVELTEVEEGVWGRDLGGFGTYALLFEGLGARLRAGDLLVGRLYPGAEAVHVPSPTVAVVRGEEVRLALIQDLERIRQTGGVNVLRISQLELEAMFFAEQGAPAGGSGANSADPEAEARELLAAAGLTGTFIEHAIRTLAASPRDPDQLVHGVEDPLAAIMDELAFETEVDLDGVRGALIRAWDLLSNGRGDHEPVDAADASQGEVASGAAQTEAVEAFARGRERGEDAADLLRKLQEDLGIGEEAEEADADRPAPDFPGVVGAMIDEMRWELAATREGHDPASLDVLEHLARFARPIGVFEELRGRDLFQFATFWLQETRALGSDTEAGALVTALGDFCEWSLEAHEVDLGSEFLDALEGLRESLPRVRRLNEALPRPEDEEGEAYELLALDDVQPSSFETSGDRVRAGQGGEEFTVIAPEPLRGALRVGDIVRARIALTGELEVVTCYPPEARALLEG